jgi:WD40 repeat protein
MLSASLRAASMVAVFLLVFSTATANEPMAKAALARLAERMKSPAADAASLRQELVALRLTVPGTPTAVRAAELLARLPSPLDRLDKMKIAPLEKFDWQPKELVGVLGEHRGRHGASVSCVAFSPNGTLIGSGGGGLVRLWTPANMRLASLAGVGYGTNSLAFSKNSRILAAGGGYIVTVFDISKTNQLQGRFTIPASTGGVYSVAFHLGNKLLAVGCYENLAKLYDVSGKEFKAVTEAVGHKKAVTAVAFSPDGKTLATGSSDATVRLWNVSGSEIKERSILEEVGNGASCLAFNASGKTLAVGSPDGTIRFYSMPGGARPKPKIIHKGPGGVTSLAFSTSGANLAATHGEAWTTVWAITGTGLKLRTKMNGHAGVATAAVYSPNMRLLVSGGNDWMVRTWDIRGTKPIQRFEPWSHLSAVHSIAFAPDDKKIVSGSEDKVIRFWDLDRPDPKTKSYLKGDSVPIYQVAYSPNGKLFAAGGASTTVRQFDASTGKPRAAFKGNPGYVNRILYLPDGKQLLTASEKEVIVWDTDKGREIRRFVSHETKITCLACSPDGRQAVAGSGYPLLKDGKYVYKAGKLVYTDCVLRFSDVQTGSETRTLKKGFDVPFYSAAFTVDGKELIAGPYEPRLRRWRLWAKEVQELENWKDTGVYVAVVLCTPDGKGILTSSASGSVKLLDAVSGKKISEWALPETVSGLAISSDSRHVGLALSTGVVYVLRLREAAK